MKKSLAVFIAVSMVMVLLAGGFVIPSAKAATTYTVTFSTQGEGITLTPIKGITAGATITLSMDRVEKIEREKEQLAFWHYFYVRGSLFKSWNTKADGSGTTFEETTPVIANITVYASFTEIFTVTFDAQGGTPTPDPITGNISGATVTLPEAPTAEGLTFVNWKVNSTTIFGATTPVVADITVYASYMKATTGSYIPGTKLVWTKKLIFQGYRVVSFVVHYINEQGKPDQTGWHETIKDLRQAKIGSLASHLGPEKWAATIANLTDKEIGALAEKYPLGRWWGYSTETSDLYLHQEVKWSDPKSDLYDIWKVDPPYITYPTIYFYTWQRVTITAP